LGADEERAGQKEKMPISQELSIISQAFVNGLRRIHGTGGFPL